ncbi:MAG: formimidoylglutamate deiminase [Burkholderiales bacterium]|nr:formimidoylglutamate deiminase [Burkholderiales bacterium]
MTAAPSPPPLWAPAAWIGGRWQAQVLLQADGSGHWAVVQPGVAHPPPGARVLAGPALPGLVNAHSHAFQRAFAGLAERRDSAQDDFWSWRERMYRVALRMSPEALEAVAAQLYAELLQGGYTQVCEFHYLHHAPDGQPYADALTMSHALLRAAAATGIGLTLLPVLYQRAGFAEPALRAEQRRFATDVATVLALRDGVRRLALPQVTAGVAIHSLRAATPEAITDLVAALAGDAAPIHLHIAEQTAEVQACLAATGQRPIDWLADRVPLDARWQLVHATHATPQEIERVARSGAGVVLCPSTEANLGDGLADLPHWLAAEAVLSVGSDSQVGRAWPAELRLLEYGQRLLRRERNVAAAPAQQQPATAARLFNRLQAGGAAAAGLHRWGFEPGARADWLVPDPQAPGLLGVPASHWLDALVFATDAPAFAEVGVAGVLRVSAGRHLAASSLAPRHAQAMADLWAEG